MTLKERNAAPVSSLVILATSDIHGNFFPYNFVTREKCAGSLARVASYVAAVRKHCGRNAVVLLDNGDLLQGQPVVYYYNYVATRSPHLAASVLKYLGYDAVTIGNHDIETGHCVYDRWVEGCHPIPVLGANVIDTSTGRPYFTPYTIVRRGGRSIAVIGLTTPAVPAWLPPGLWSGMSFTDMAAEARRLVSEVRALHNPDLVVGLFHSGADPSRNTAGFSEHASIEIARGIDGFDAIVFGHDHVRCCATVESPGGKPVAVVNPAQNGRTVGRLDVTFAADGTPRVKPSLIDVDALPPSRDFTQRFRFEVQRVQRYVNRHIGVSSGEFTTRDSFFGSSAFVDLLHRVQLRVSGADISMAAPLSLDATINQGNLTVADMFALYRFENSLSVVELTGSEIESYLELSYDNWIQTMGSASDPMLRLNHHPDGLRAGFENPLYNFDSAAGIDYTVDLTKPAGGRIAVTSLSAGRPFIRGKVYRVAMNSYRACGGGDLLTLGSRLSRDELPGRIRWTSPLNIRHYLIEYVETEGTISPVRLGNWRFIPADFATEARLREYPLLFPK